MNPPISITGVWIRTSGVDGGLSQRTRRRLEVLVEVDGVFRLVQTHWDIRFDGEVSHITEPHGIANAPPDYLPGTRRLPKLRSKKGGGSRG